MKIIDCRYCVRRRPPRGSVYIGRAMGKLERSPLANPFVPRSSTKSSDTAIVVPDEVVLDRYARHLIRNVAQGFAELRALRDLGKTSRLACWCADRDASLVGAGRPQPDTPCHGDVVFTVWAALERLHWRVDVLDRRPERRRIIWDPAAGRLVDPVEDLDAANAVIGELYKQSFGEPMAWGSREAA